MKKFSILVSILFTFIGFAANAQCGDELVDDCAADLEGSVYLKDFRVKLEQAEKNQPAPVKRISVVLNKGTTYHFSVCNAAEYEGNAVIQLYDSSKLLGSTLNMATGKLYDNFEMACSKTGVYYIFVSFKEGKEGCAAAILSYVEE